MVVTIRVNVINNINRVNRQKTKQIQSAIKQIGFFIEGEVKQSISGHRAEPRSVDKGTFLNKTKASFPNMFETIIKSGVPYAKHLEFGTSRIRPRKHFRNTAARNKMKIMGFIKKKLRRII